MNGVSLNPRQEGKSLAQQQARVVWVVDGLDDDKLTLKEASFVESIEKQSADGRFLSEAQMSWLESIYERKSR